jgi:hypothetical protein
MPRNTSSSHPTGEAPMNIVERARVALRNWINKPSQAEAKHSAEQRAEGREAARRVREETLRDTLNQIGTAFDQEAEWQRNKGTQSYQLWLESQRAWVQRLEAEGAPGELDVRGRALLRAKVDERLSPLALATAG